jgi:cell wall-associated NlpC family hydrolase
MGESARFDRIGPDYLKGRRVRRTGRPIAAVLTAACMVAFAAAPAYADHIPGPTARDVARAKAAAAAKADQAGRARANLALANAQLRTLQQRTQAAIANYQSAMTRLGAAQIVAARATIALQSADQQLSAQQRQLAAFAASAYRSGGTMGMWSALLTADGPKSFLDSANAISAISANQADALQRFRAAQVVHTLAQQQARSALSAVQLAVDATKVARDHAEQAVNDQQHQVTVLARQRVHLAAQARSAKSHANALARERAANLAAARAAAEAARQRALLGQGGVDQENPTSVTGGPRPAATAQQGREAVAFAKQQLGKPYQWGASGPGTYDCSGLTMMSWNAAGISIDHWSVAQYGEGTHVSRIDLRPGDLVFFAYNTSDASTIHHVGIYVGNGTMIDAPHTGADVRYDSAFRSDYIGATRP